MVEVLAEDRRVVIHVGHKCNDDEIQLETNRCFKI